MSGASEQGQGRRALAGAEAAARQTPRGTPRVPAALSPLLGRATETESLRRAIVEQGSRLLSIVGPGGVGKTRLALHLAAQLPDDPATADRLHDGAVFVSLATVAVRPDALDALALAIAEALRLDASDVRPRALQLQDFLSDKALLLVLDNAEHLLAGAPLVGQLLAAAPELVVVVTSRERLGLQGEHVFQLRGLDWPAEQAAPSTAHSYGALRLFEAAARSYDPSFVLNAADLAAVVRICKLVEGLPLALELAAGWTRMLSCAEIGDEIARSLDFLDAATRDRPARQRSLRAVFDGSWSLLQPSERAALRQLAVFRGSFGRHAAERVAGASLPVLAALVDKSLVRRVMLEGGGPQRFELVELVRQYAEEQLMAAGEAEAARARHAVLYLALLERAASLLRGSGQQAALAELSLEVDQIRTAWRWAVAQRDADSIVRVAPGLFHFYDMRSWFAEGADAFGAARAALEDHGSAAQLAWAIVSSREAWFSFHLGQQRAAQRRLEAALAVLRAYGESDATVFALNYLAAVCAYLGEHERTDMLGGESLALAKAHGDAYGQAVAYNILGQSAYDRGDLAAAARWSRASLAIDDELGNHWSMAYALTTLGNVASAEADGVTAGRLFEQSRTIRAALGDRRGVALCLSRLGDTAAQLGDEHAAGEHYAASWRLFRELGNQWGVAAALVKLGQLATSHGRTGAAARLLGEALRLAVRIDAAPQLGTIREAAAALVMRSGLAAVPREDWSPDELAALLERLSATSAVELLSVEQAVAAAQAGTPVEAPAGKTSRFPAGLTAREVDVLRLVAQGLTDAEVAERLVVSRRTVTTHLTSIYTKLQVTGRSAATRFAVEHQLV